MLIAGYAQEVPLPLTVSCFSKIQIGFTSVVPAHPCSPGQRTVKQVCECVCVMGLSAGDRVDGPVSDTLGDISSGET